MKNKNKIIQDPVHGYIEVESMFIKIVDSIEFQRLKWIEQGSFRVLYPAARHDRFIHSLGTYFIAKKASESFFINIKVDILEENIFVKYEEKKLRNTFLYAALLHDIGHAPFSHTCENYFNIEESSESGVKKIDNDLLNAIESSLQISDDKKNSFLEGYNEFKHLLKPSPHEIVSATMLINKVSNFLDEKNYELIDLELAARMVIGFRYKNSSKDQGIENCLIGLLNSNTVDVDKLDYICRDTKMMGFSNAAIDIERITKGITAVLVNNKGFQPAFRKNTLSNIDNVFRAKEEQGKWVISHPVVVYESELIKQCVKEVDEKESDKKELGENGYINTVFSYEALCREGIGYKGRRYKLLSDTDIISDFKNYIDNPIINEYFERSARRKPIWKSYYEYVYMVNQLKKSNQKKAIKGMQSEESKELDKFYRYFSPLIEYMISEKKFILNTTLYNEICVCKIVEVKRAAELLKKVCEESSVKLDLVLIKFKNDFASKIHRNEIYIKFPKAGPCTYESLEGVRGKVDENAFFYLYSKEQIDKEFIINKVPEIMDIMSTVYNEYCI